MLSKRRAQVAEPDPGLSAEIDELAAGLDSLTSRGAAIVFGVCGRALAPLLKQVELRSGGAGAFPISSWR